MKIVHAWLAELVDVPDDVARVASEIALRGFEVAETDAARGVIDFEVTANRPDCLSHLGFAREAAVIWSAPLRPPPLAALAPEQKGSGQPVGDAALTVDVEDQELCPRYCAQLFDVSVGPSPPWLAQRLEAAGVRPINNVVDVTNYVMLELGQSMHAFDVRKLAGRRLVIRRARAGETLRTLDGVDRTLDSEMLVIADAERATAVGGVMGGRDSEIGAETKTIALESAYFQPASVRRTSKRLGLKTEASIRFERGADIAAPPVGLARAAALFERIGAGRPAGPLVDRYASPRVTKAVTLRTERITRLLGQQVPSAEVPRILEPLGFRVAAEPTPPSERWSVTVPSFRVDVSREADLVEEVGRHHGFDRLPMTFPALRAPQAPPDPAVGRSRTVRQVLTAAGFSEAMTFAFIERAAALPFAEDGSEPHAVANPLSEKFAVLRPSLLPGLLDAAVHNRRRELRDIRLFEIGSRFTPAGEGRGVAFVWCGAALAPHWSAPARNADFFDVKGVVERLAGAFGVVVEAVGSARAFLEPGRAAEIWTIGERGRRLLGVAGQLAAHVVAARGFPPGEEAYGAELDASALGLLSAVDDPRAQPLPRHPSIVRDISILVDEALPAGTVRGTIRSAAPATLASIIEFDRYQGKGVPDGRVSLSLRLTFRAPDRTLTDEEVQDAMARILSALRTHHHAEQR
ncbi:MAG TPA: phenylalanine--tRNA ligase subunit beta [Vicinamibacterales bacterium]|nr:phenylalanine--tRNA ligase subunit beta [Vicinamibacterales bacterium]